MSGGATGPRPSPGKDFFLVPHPHKPGKSVQHVNVSLTRSQRSLHVTYVVEGPTERLVLPPPAKPYRTDELWRSTCFEIFLATHSEHYTEFNFSPSSQWAKYRFDAYRSGMISAEVEDPPIVRVCDEGYCLIVPVTIASPGMADGVIGLSAVIEEIDGTKSYWALAHAPGPPDFHNRECWTARLPALDPS